MGTVLRENMRLTEERKNQLKDNDDLQSFYVSVFPQPRRLQVFNNICSPTVQSQQ
jgi:hypothetical protein